MAAERPGDSTLRFRRGRVPPPAGRRWPRRGGGGRRLAGGVAGGGPRGRRPHAALRRHGGGAPGGGADPHACRALAGDADRGHESPTGGRQPVRALAEGRPARRRRLHPRDGAVPAFPRLGGRRLPPRPSSITRFGIDLAAAEPARFEKRTSKRGSDYRWLDAAPASAAAVVPSAAPPTRWRDADQRRGPGAATGDAELPKARPCAPVNDARGGPLEVTTEEREGAGARPRGSRCRGLWQTGVVGGALDAQPPSSKNFTAAALCAARPGPRRGRPRRRRSAASFLSAKGHDGEQLLLKGSPLRRPETTATDLSSPGAPLPTSRG